MNTRAFGVGYISADVPTFPFYDIICADFLVLFFTETFFYIGVAVFLAVADKVQRTTGVVTWNVSNTQASLGYQISAYVTLALTILLPIGAFAIVWPWTGPAAAAALVPYVVGLGVQYGIEHIVQERKSSVWPLIPIVFQVATINLLTLGIKCK
jgi:sterol desaturase/sphingolipid hydroxylase (fatty acid hydroxylase superfamily)